MADLRTRFGEQLKPHEPQLAKAAAIADPAARKAAIADVESQVTAQQENLALVAELKKADPKMTNKQIADKVADKIKVPRVPHGMDADEFRRAQELIKKFLQEKGITDAEGFATGSRITGVTFNPKKPAFGQAIGRLRRQGLRHHAHHDACALEGRDQEAAGLVRGRVQASARRASRLGPAAAGVSCPYTASWRLEPEMRYYTEFIALHPDAPMPDEATFCPSFWRADDFDSDGDFYADALEGRW